MQVIPCCQGLRVLLRLKCVNKWKDSFDGTAAAYLSSLQIKATLLCPTISLSGGRHCCCIWLLSATCVHGAHVHLKSCGSQKIVFYISSCISSSECYPKSLLTLKLLQPLFPPSSASKWDDLAFVQPNARTSLCKYMTNVNWWKMSPFGVLLPLLLLTVH